MVRNMSFDAVQARSLASLGLNYPPVAVAFADEPAAGLSRVSRAEAAGCGYWRLAFEGRAFYTSSDDHGNCPIGAFTHGVELTPDKTRELETMVGTMVELKYIKSDEVPSIPHRSEPMRLALYAPLDRATFTADVVLFRGNVRQIMLVTEAARSAGVFEESAVLGRPACAMIPQALGTRTSVASVACIGNRVYTSLGDDELYVAVPGAAVERVIAALGSITAANAELEKFHKSRAAAFAG
jgi:uncharacterized protein (DUF169 family)